MTVQKGVTLVRPKQEDFEQVKHLGNGSVGTVTQVRHKESGAVYALKAVDKRRILEHDLGGQLLSEVRTQLSLSHTNLLRCHDYFEDAGYVFLLLEYASDGDLFRLLKKRGSLGEADTAYVFAQVVEGVGHLHHNGIVHRDLKPENVLLGPDLHVKVGDFGWCAKAEGRTTFCGTVCMLAPEMVTGSPYDERVDVWALGVLLFEMLTGSSPFDRGGSLLETCENIVKKGLDDTLLQKVPAAAQPLVQGLLMKQASERISLQEALQDGWLVDQLERRTAAGLPPLPSTALSQATKLPVSAPAPAVDEATTLPAPPARKSEEHGTLPVPRSRANEQEETGALPVPRSLASEEEERGTLPGPQSRAGDDKETLPIPRSRAGEENGEETLPVPRSRSSDEAETGTMTVPRSHASEQRVAETLHIPRGQAREEAESLQVPDSQKRAPAPTPSPTPVTIEQATPAQLAPTPSRVSPEIGEVRLPEPAPTPTLMGSGLVASPAPEPVAATATHADVRLEETMPAESGPTANLDDDEWGLPPTAQLLVEKLPAPSRHAASKAGLGRIEESRDSHMSPAIQAPSERTTADPTSPGRRETGALPRGWAVHGGGARPGSNQLNNSTTSLARDSTGAGGSASSAIPRGSRYLPIPEPRASADSIGSASSGRSALLEVVTPSPLSAKNSPAARDGLTPHGSYLMSLRDLPSVDTGTQAAVEPSGASVPVSASVAMSPHSPVEYLHPLDHRQETSRSVRDNPPVHEKRCPPINFGALSDNGPVHADDPGNHGGELLIPLTQLEIHKNADIIEGLRTYERVFLGGVEATGPPEEGPPAARVPSMPSAPVLDDSVPVVVRPGLDEYAPVPKARAKQRSKTPHFVPDGAGGGSPAVSPRWRNPAASWQAQAQAQAEPRRAPEGIRAAGGFGAGSASGAGSPRFGVGSASVERLGRLPLAASGSASPGGYSPGGYRIGGGQQPHLAGLLPVDRGDRAPEWSWEDEEEFLRRAAGQRTPRQAKEEEELRRRAAGQLTPQQAQAGLNNSWLSGALSWVGMNPTADVQDATPRHHGAQPKAQAQAQPPPQLSPAQRQLMEQLMSLGFAHNQASEAVRRTSTVEAAVDWIIQHPR